MMMYEGYITDDSGQPLSDGPYDFRFSLYESPEGGAPVWAEEHLGVEVVDGVVQVRLGEGTPPAPLDIPFDAQYYLGVQLGDDSEMVPRLQLMTTAYAFRARVADEVPDGSITSEKLTPLSVTDGHITSVSWEKITDVPEIPGAPPRGGGPVPANVWHTRGNRNTDPERNYVGTAEVVDLILATNGEERLRIAGDGSSITIKADTLAAKYILSRAAARGWQRRHRHGDSKRQAAHRIHGRGLGLGHRQLPRPSGNGSPGNGHTGQHVGRGRGQ
jgi:hypothetical protein